MANFASVTDVVDFLQVDISTDSQIASAERALTAASAAIRNYTKQTIEQVADDEVTFDGKGGARLYLPQLPVVSVSKVVEDGETLVDGTDYKLGAYGILHRLEGNEWAEGLQNITVTYTHGYETIPDDIVDVCTRAAARAYQLGLRSAEDAGVPGVASKQLGDFAVTYASEAGGGVGEGVMGASAARMLLLSEKDMLNEYRIKQP